MSAAGIAAAIGVALAAGTWVGIRYAEARTLLDRDLADFLLTVDLREQPDDGGDPVVSQ